MFTEGWLAKHIVAVVFFFLVVSLGVEIRAVAQRGQPRASDFRLEKLEGTLGNRLYITVNGRERKISNQALEAWLIDDGKSVAYSWLDGAGGFENEGQSLRIFDVRTGKTRKVLSEYMGIVALMPVRLSNGQLALLIKMADGGLGASYFAVVDPKRGEVFYRRWAELTELAGDRIKLAFYDPEDWDQINEARGAQQDNPNQVISHTTVKPKRTENHDLKRVVRMQVRYQQTAAAVIEMGKVIKRRILTGVLPLDYSTGNEAPLFGLNERYEKRSDRKSMISLPLLYLTSCFRSLSFS